jgi:MinD-like ATPase involved in chromosome partitioning or flagellar assembly
MNGVLTAGSGQQWESDLVSNLEQPGSPLTVVRRCADIGEVLATAATGRARVAVVDGSLRRLDTDAVQRLRAAGVAVIGIYPAADERAQVRLERLGITALVADDAGPAAMLAAAQVAIAAIDTAGPRPGDAADPSRAYPPPALPTAVPASEPVAPGSLIAVWGPTGAPGRSTVALGIADAVSSAGQPTLLIDADVYGGVLASAFGVLDESPGLAGACRLAANGRLTPAELDQLCWSVTPTLRLLSGISRADRWPELRPSALPQVIAAARTLAPVTVVDCGFAIEADEELSFDTLAPRRNGATLAFLAAADRVLVVGSADPPGLERLVRALGDLQDSLPDVQPEVVLNRVRSSVAPGWQATQALHRFTGLTETAQLPEDRAATDEAWARGVPISVVAPKSVLRAAFTTLAAAMVPVPVGPS